MLMTFRKFLSSIHIILFLIIAVFSVTPWPYIMLTSAQLLFIPIALRLVMHNRDWFSKRYFSFAVPAYTAVAILQLTADTPWDGLLAAIYLGFTILVASYGFTRFFQRGFSHLEEFSIDMGLMYLAMGGAWFFAYEANIPTGFSPLITWLTGIHFHYSAFLLPIFVGFLGRLNQSSLYKLVVSVILLSPMIVAIGITFSRWLELVSVIIYIIGIYGLILLSFQTHFSTPLQKWFVRTSFAALGVTIGFSFLYALGNVWGLFTVTIDFMLRFHGLLNCVVFALCGIIGWSLIPPSSQMRKLTFPVSKIRGKHVIGEKFLEDKVDVQLKYDGLIDSMAKYQVGMVSPAIIDFYENTSKYRLFAKVKWAGWFKPFAFVYRFGSLYVGQINLPLSKKRIEMTGNIIPIQDGLDGRSGTRAWVRKVNGEVAFVALYAEHSTKSKTYMNIALPLPQSSMIGILELDQMNDGLRLTSKKLSGPDSDAGIYLAWGSYLLKLPLEEVFHVNDVGNGKLKAKHKMWIFSIPFLTIDYEIIRRDFVKI